MATGASGVDCSAFILFEAGFNEDTDPKHLAQVVDELRLDHDGVRFSIQRKVGGRLTLGIFGPRSVAHAAHEALASQVPVKLANSSEIVFALHVSLRDLGVEGGSYDDELEEALHDRDGILLAGPEESDEEFDEAGLCPGSVESVVASRIESLMRPHSHVHLFMDENPFAGYQEKHFTEGPVTMGFIGSLSAWDATVQLINAVKSVHMPLSERYDVIFWCTGGVCVALEEQMHQAAAHWKGDVVRLGSGIGLGRAAWSGFPDLTANVSAVLRGEQTPGWRRVAMVLVGGSGACFLP